MPEHDHHGQSTAAWVGVAIMLVASAIACYAVLWGTRTLLIIGLALALVGALVWYVMYRSGFGPEGKDTIKRAHADREVVGH